MAFVFFCLVCSHTIQIGNLAYTVTEEDILSIVADCGPVTSIDVRLVPVHSFRLFLCRFPPLQIALLFVVTCRTLTLLTITFTCLKELIFYVAVRFWSAACNAIVLCHQILSVEKALLPACISHCRYCSILHNWLSVVSRSVFCTMPFFHVSICYCGKKVAAQSYKRLPVDGPFQKYRRLGFFVYSNVVNDSTHLFNAVL